MSFGDHRVLYHIGTYCANCVNEYMASPCVIIVTYVLRNYFCFLSAIREVYQTGLTMSSSRHETGTSTIHMELERTVAEFLGVDDAISIGMGFATNTLNLPVLIGEGCLVLSDQLNHASIRLGMRLSGAKVVQFNHNSVEHLEKMLRTNIIKGNE